MKQLLITLLTAIILATPVGQSVGTLEIDGLTTVELKTITATNSEEAGRQAQQIVDGPGACIFRVYGGYYIADHSNQNFSCLTEVQVGDTAIITFEDGTERNLVCLLVDTMGYTDGAHICRSTGERAEDLVEEAYVMYTCAYAFSGNRMVTVWEVQDDV